MLDLITVTKQNYEFAVAENWRRIYRELQYKIPVSGSKVELQGVLDFDSTYTIYDITVNGDHSAFPQSEA